MINKPKSYREYKKLKDLQESYKEASKIEEAFALATLSTCGMSSNKPYEGYLAVQDILNKIGAMVRMFETSLQDGSTTDSISKEIDIVSNLYDLAQIKLSEAKKQSTDYMAKCGGVQSATPTSMGPLGGEMTGRTSPEEEVPSKDFKDSSSLPNPSPDLSSDSDSQSSTSPKPPANFKPQNKLDFDSDEEKTDISTDKNKYPYATGVESPPNGRSYQD